MFIQVIEGQVSNAAAVRSRLDRWVADLAAGAEGWLGTTAGVTEGGTFVAVARFDSEDAARRNSDRREQGEWWAETATLFEGAPTFVDSSDVATDLVGDPGRAGFVQVMKGRTTDPDRARELAMQDSQEWATFRPDVLGSVLVGHGDNNWIMVIYFTSEAEAREGERKEMPAVIQAQMEEMNALNDGEPEFLDIREPWLYSPATSA
jgi:hypothetical protein